MAEKSSATVSKKSAAPAKRTATRQRANKGDTMSCEVCGFTVTVDEACDCAEVHEILCCGEPMKAKVSKASKTSQAKPKAKAESKAKPKAKAAAAKSK